MPMAMNTGIRSFFSNSLYLFICSSFVHSIAASSFVLSPGCGMNEERYLHSIASFDFDFLSVMIKSGFMFALTKIPFCLLYRSVVHCSITKFCGNKL